MIDAAPVAYALRRLSRVDDITLAHLTAGTSTTRADLQRALVTGRLAPADLETALRHADPECTVHMGPQER